MDKCKALAHPLPTLAALAPTSSPLQQQRFFAKATSPAPEPSRIVPSSQAIRRRNSPVKYREVPTEQSDEQQVVFELFECLLDLGEADVVLPQGGGVFVGQVGAQQIPAFAPAHGAQLVAAQGEGEGLGGDGLVRVGELNLDQMISTPSLFLGGPELEQQRIAGQCLLLQLVGGGAQSVFSRRRRIARSLRVRGWLRARM